MGKRWVICKICGRERYVQYWGKEQKENLCRSCSLTLRHKRMPNLCRGANNPNWKGGIRRGRKDGYVAIRLEPDDFFYLMANKQDIVLEHRLVVAKALNRCLLSWETVHHINGIKDDNRIENLQLLPSVSTHNALTRMARYIKKLQREIERLQIQLQNK